MRQSERPNQRPASVCPSASARPVRKIMTPTTQLSATLRASRLGSCRGAAAMGDHLPTGRSAQVTTCRRADPINRPELRSLHRATGPRSAHRERRRRSIAFTLCSHTRASVAQARLAQRTQRAGVSTGHGLTRCWFRCPRSRRTYACVGRGSDGQSQGRSVLPLVAPRPATLVRRRWRAGPAPVGLGWRPP